MEAHILGLANESLASASANVTTTMVFKGHIDAYRPRKTCRGELPLDNRCAVAPTPLACAPLSQHRSGRLSFTPWRATSQTTHITHYNMQVHTPGGTDAARFGMIWCRRAQSVWIAASQVRGLPDTARVTDTTDSGGAVTDIHLYSYCVMRGSNLIDLVELAQQAARGRHQRHLPPPGLILPFRYTENHLWQWLFLLLKCMFSGSPSR